MLKAIVFDFDGVLVDSEPLHFAAFREVGRTLGVDLDYQRYLGELVGFDDRDVFNHLLRDPDTAAHQEPIAGLCQRKQAAFEDLVNRGIAPIPGAMELVDAAAAVMPIAIASGAVQSDITLILEKLQRLHMFEVIVTADHVARSKPDPESYALAVDKLAQQHPELALEPAYCLAIEDTAAGLASARGAGLRTLGVTTTAAADQLEGAERVVEDLNAATVDKLRNWYG